MALTAKKVYAILKRQISDMEAKLNSPVRYRGTVATADLLPLNPDIGDMYNIESKSVYGEAGMNVAWNGVVWDTMGAPIDMSLYLTKEEAEAVIQRLVTEYFEKNPVKPGATTEQAQQIEQNKTDIASLKTETSSLKEDLVPIKNNLNIVNNFVTKHNLFGFARDYVIGKYYDGNANANTLYNYYSEIPINKGDSYKFTENVRLVVIKENGVQKEIISDVTKFTSKYDGVAYVTIYADKPDTAMAYNNDFNYASTISSDIVNSRTISSNGAKSFGEEFSVDYKEGDLIYFESLSVDGGTFANCLVYFYINESFVIQKDFNNIYNLKKGGTVKATSNVSKVKIYVTLTEAKQSTFKYKIVNLSNHTVVNDVDGLMIKQKFSSELLGKKIACLGDSFTYGIDTYVEKMNRDFVCFAINYGLPSSRIVRDIPNVESFNTRYTSMADDAEIITIFGGINDSYDLGNGDLTLGNMDSPLDLTSFYGGMRKLIEGLILKYPDKKIIGIIPPDCQVGYYADNLPIIQSAEREIYNYYGIPFIDLRKECYKMSTNIPKMIELYRSSATDIHPSNAGQEALKDSISAGVRRYI